MIKRHFDSPPLIHPDIVHHTREITVRKALSAKGVPVPVIHLQGQWLHEAYFETGRNVRIDVAPHALVLRTFRYIDGEDA